MPNVYLTAASRFFALETFRLVNGNRLIQVKIIEPRMTGKIGIFQALAASGAGLARCLKLFQKSNLSRSFDPRAFGSADLANCCFSRLAL